MLGKLVTLLHLYTLQSVLIVTIFVRLKTTGHYLLVFRNNDGLILIVDIIVARMVNHGLTTDHKFIRDLYLAIMIKIMPLFIPRLIFTTYLFIWQTIPTMVYLICQLRNFSWVLFYQVTFYLLILHYFYNVLFSS